MKLGFMTIAKVYRKKDVQEITDRATGRVTGEYYPVILDDGEDTLDATVPKDVYNGIEEDKIYLFAGTYDELNVQIVMERLGGDGSGREAHWHHAHPHRGGRGKARA